MSGPTRPGGFGHTVGLGVGAAILITVIAGLRVLAAQLEGAMHAVILVGTIALCVTLGAAALAVLGLVAYRAQLARYHLAERRIALEQLARQGAVHVEVLGDQAQAEALEAPGVLGPSYPAARAILGRQPGTVPGRRLEAVPDPGDSGGA